jgi:hypothetical protein
MHLTWTIWLYETYTLRAPLLLYASECCPSMDHENMNSQSKESTYPHQPMDSQSNENMKSANSQVLAKLHTLYLSTFHV